MELIIGIALGIAASLAVNYLFPAVFGKLTRKAGRKIDQIRDAVDKK